MNGLTVEVGDRKDPLTIPLLLEIVKDPFKGYFGSLVSEDEWVSGNGKSRADALA